jgi:hypothetical protein
LTCTSASIGQEVEKPRAERSEPKPNDAPTPDSGNAEKQTDKSLSIERPVYLFMNGPFDLANLWKRLTDPDYVLLKGAEYQKLFDQAHSKTASVRPQPFVIESLEIKGEVTGDRARLTLDALVTLRGEGSERVPLRLDRQVVTDVREADRAILPRARDDGGWEVELAGEGQHRLQIGLLASVASNPDGQRLELAIPEVASTRIALDLPGDIVDASAGPNEHLGFQSGNDGRAKRVVASLTSRSQLILTWRVAASQETTGPPLLSALGETSIEIDRGTIRTRSIWSVRCERGSTDRFEIKLDPSDELVGLELDDQPIALEDRRDSATGLVAIPLPTPLRLGAQRRVTIATRRSIPAGVTTRLSFGGCPFENAADQSGVIAIVQGGDLWVSGSAGRGLRRIDPRSELPASLRARPSTVLAYKFVEQPFDLGIRVDPSPPSVQVDSQTTIAVNGRVAHVDSTLDYRVTRGRVFEVRVAMPRDLELETVGPDSAVEEWQSLDDVAPEADREERAVVVRLAARAREDGQFRLRLSGRQRIGASDGPVRVGLFQPRGASVRIGQLAVVAAKNVGIDLEQSAEPKATAGWFEPAIGEVPTDWPWPASRQLLSRTPALWLRLQENPAFVLLRVTLRQRTLEHESMVSARVHRDGLDVRQEFTCRARNGDFSRIELLVPPPLEGRWDLEGDDVTSRERLTTRSDGAIVYGLVLSRTLVDTLRLRFRFRFPLERPLGHDRATQVRFPWLRLETGTGAPVQIQITADPGVQLADARGWTRSVFDARDGTDEGIAAASLSWTGPDNSADLPQITAALISYASMPSVVASRLWLRTTRRPDGELLTRARYRIESDCDSVALALPTGAHLEAARIGNQSAVDPENVPGGLRIPLPRDPSGATLVELEFTVPASRVTSAWAPPMLLDGGVVQQTYWELVLPWSRALVGTPLGWADQNGWRWDRYMWKRQARMSRLELAEWVGGDSLRSRLAAETGRAEVGDDTVYLFGREGIPTAFQPEIYPRAILIGVYSGAVLAIGILFLIWRPPGRVLWLAGLVLVLVVAAAVRPSVIFVALQSSAVGVVLTVVAALTQGLVERRRAPAALYQEHSGLGAGTRRTGSSLSPMPLPGSDESTVIRTRTATTAEHVAINPDRASVEDSV